ncbi:MAG: leucine-rich repeat domain-containing protein [Kiritimatiellae bacterium]|nr:leucine-rich repeat domain-containing protein [Kiritimatiellia bacterium]
MKYSLASTALITLFATSLFAADDFWLYDPSAKTMTWEDETGFINVVKTSGDDGSSIVIKEGVNRATTAIRNLDLSLSIRDASGNEYVITEFVGSSQSAFGYNSSITNVVLPSGLKTLPPFAFKNCSELISVTLNDGLEIIDNEAFNGCSALKQIYNFFPSSLVEIKSKAFYSCSGLECGAVISGVTNMADRIFHSSSLRSFDCEQAPLKILPEFTFYNCKQLTNVVLSQDLEVIKDGCFENCYALTTVKHLLPKSLTKLGFGSNNPVFFDNKALQGEVIVGPYLEEIKLRTFRGSKIGSFVAAKNGLKSLGQYCFYGCNDLTNIVLSATIEKLDYSILEGTSSSSAQRKIYLRNFPSGGITSSLFNGTKRECITIYLPWDYQEEWRTFAATNSGHNFIFNKQAGALPEKKNELGTWQASITQNVTWWQEFPPPSTIILR